MEGVLKVPATMQNYRGMSHRSMRITFDTQENLTSDTISQITRQHEKMGHLLFLVEDVKESKILEMATSLPPLEKQKEKKSKAQRLRSSLYVLWKQSHEDKYEEFESFYSLYMENVISNVQKQIN